MQRGELWWAELPAPRASEPGLRRPIPVIQADRFNRSRIGTVVIAVITSDMRLADAPGSVRLAKRQGKLPKESVVNVSQLMTLDRAFLSGKIGRLPAKQMREVDTGLRLVLAV